MKKYLTQMIYAGMVMLLLGLFPILVLGFNNISKEGKAVPASASGVSIKWLDIIKQNINIPSSPSGKEGVPAPNEILGRFSPKLQEINDYIRDEVGIDFAKLISWFGKILKILFEVLLGILERVAGALSGSTR